MGRFGSGLRAVGAGLTAALVAAAAACAADPPPVEAYGKLPAIDGPKLSPDGSRAAFLSSASGRRCLAIVALDTDQPRRSLCPGRYEVRWFAWKTDERLILEVYMPSRLHGDDPRTDSWLIAADADGTHLRGLADAREEHAADFGDDQVVDMLPDDPRHILIARYESGRDSPDVLRLDVNSGTTHQLVEGQKRITRWKTDGAGQVRLGVAIDGKVIRTWYRDDADQDFRLIDERDLSLAGGFSVLAFGDRPGQLYVASSDKTGRRAVYGWDVGQQRFTGQIASRPDADIDSLTVDRGQVLGYGYRDDEPEFQYIDPVLKADSDRIAEALPQFRTTMVDSTADGRRALVLAAGGNRPGMYYLLTRGSSTATLVPLGAIRPDIPDAALAPVRPVVYRARDGLAIHAYVTLPPGAPGRPIPFVVMPHGGPSARDILGFDYIAQMVASRGYGVIQPNFRGSQGYGAAFEKAGFQQWGLLMQDDVTDAAHWLVDQKLADPSRICIVGWSYGGYAALMGAIKTPDLFRCAVSMAGVSDLRRRLDRASRSRWPDLNLPRYDSDPGAVEANSPVLHADRVRIPILLVHGRGDFTVPVEDTEAMEDALKRAGKSVQTLYFDDDDHYLFREGDRIAFLGALDRFLKDNLGPGALTLSAPGATN